MMLPENESEPMSVANSIVTAKNGVMPSGLCARRRNSRLATSAAEPPPRPLNAATICGMAVILTEYAPGRADGQTNRNPDGDQTAS